MGFGGGRSWPGGMRAGSGGRDLDGDWIVGLDVALGGGKTTTGAGISTSVPQFGHFPFFPAAASGVRTCWWQIGQGNSIGMAGGVGGRLNGVALGPVRTLGTNLNCRGEKSHAIVGRICKPPDGKPHWNDGQLPNFIAARCRSFRCFVGGW